jgi:DNA-binding response OmpR family regulator
MYEALKTKSALYIEDEKDVLKNISELLSQFFHDFYTASDGEEGYRIFQEKEIDLLLVDIELPKMNGITLIKKIRQIDKRVPIVVISAYTKTDYLLESIELHLDKYIVKPLTSRKIHSILSTLNDDFSGERTLSCTDGVELDCIKNSISHDGGSYALTKKEMEFLTILCQKKMVTYDEIMALWEDDVPSENAVRSFIKHLRKKLPEAFLKNRNSVGYYVEENR